MPARRENDPRWGEVFVEEATDGPGRARLAREAEALRRARHPCVIELLEHADDGSQARLFTRPPSSRSLADMRPLVTDQVAAIGAALAQAMADLHRLGVTHGGLRPHHVLLTPLGQPVLRGFAQAGLLQPPAGQSSAFDPASDVEALADMLESLLDPAEAAERRGGSLVVLLHSAISCPMEQLAADLAKMAGPLRPPLVADADPLDWTEDATCEFWPTPPLSKPVELAGRSRRTVVLAAIVALVAIVAGATTVTALGGPGEPAPAQAAPVAGADRAVQTTDSDPPKPEAPPRQQTDGASPVSGESPATPTTEPDGPAACPTTHNEAAVVGISAGCIGQASANGNQIQVGALSWTIGGPDDLAVPGDFDCDGWLEVAALAMQTGDVVVFDRWAGEGQEPVGLNVRRVPSANRLEAQAAGACHRLAVHRPQGAAVTIDVAPALDPVKAADSAKAG